MSGVLFHEENGQCTERVSEEVAVRHGRQLFGFMASNPRFMAIIRVNNLREIMNRVLIEYNAVRDRCSLEQLALQESTISKVKELKGMLETCMNLRDVGSVGCMLSAIGRAIAIAKNAHSNVKLGLMGIGLLSATLASSQRRKISNIVEEIRNILLEDFAKFQAFSEAVQTLDDAIYHCFGMRLFSQQFQEICDRLQRPPEHEGESEFDTVLESVTENVQEVLKSVSADDKLKTQLKKVFDGTMRRYIHCSLMSHYIGLVFEMVPDTLMGTEAELALLPLQFACHCILFLNERSSDAAKLAEVDDGIERMTDELSLMRMVREFCNEVDRRDPR